MILGTRCLAAAALDGPAICAALKALHLERALLHLADGDARGAGLAEVPAAGVRCAWDHRRAGLLVARQARAARLVLDLPGDLPLLPACRRLFDFSGEAEGLPLAVIAPATGDLSDPGGLALLLSELGRFRLGWWHLPSRVQLAGGDQATWYERLGRHLAGVSLDDVADGRPGLPPGLGRLDLRPLAELTGRSVEATLDPDPLPDPALLAPAVETLRAAGFR